MKEYKQDENADDLIKEPAFAYEAPSGLEEMAAIIDEEMDIDAYYEKNKEAIEAANERIHIDKTKALKGYYTLEEFDKLFKKKLSDAYAAL